MTRARPEAAATEDFQSITRRTLARGAAWTAPMVVVAVAAPAYAVSTACVGGQALIVDGTEPTFLTFPPSAVTATLSFASAGYGADATPGETGQVHITDYSPKWAYIKLHHPKGMHQGNTITLTLTLSQPVGNLSLTITDIDKTIGEWIDEVVVNTPSFTSVAAVNVIGTGTSADPFRSKVNSGITSAAGDVKLTWAGPLSAVQLTYRAADVTNSSDIGQHVGVGMIGFGNC